jgi:hypothetical protein
MSQAEQSVESRAFDSSDGSSKCQSNDSFKVGLPPFQNARLTIPFFERKHRALRGHSACEHNMSRTMQRGYENPRKLLNGFQPVDGACTAHGSDLA